MGDIWCHYYGRSVSVWDTSHHLPGSPRPTDEQSTYRRAIVFVIVDKIDFVINILALFILKEYRSREHTAVDVIWDFFHVSFILAVSVGVGCVCMRVSVCERDIELEEDIHVCIIFIVDKHK